MFPTLYHFLYDVTGISLPFLKVVNTFGFFVAMSIGAAFWAMSSEFDRRTSLGQFAKVKVKQLTGVGVARNEYILNAAMAFVFGYKILFLMVETGDGFLLRITFFLPKEVGCLVHWRWFSPFGGHGSLIKSSAALRLLKLS